MKIFCFATLVAALGPLFSSQQVAAQEDARGLLYAISEALDIQSHHGVDTGSFGRELARAGFAPAAANQVFADGQQRSTRSMREVRAARGGPLSALPDGMEKYFTLLEVDVSEESTTVIVLEGWDLQTGPRQKVAAITEWVLIFERAEDGQWVLTDKNTRRVT